MSTIGKRLAELATIYPASPGCDACRAWSQVAAVFDDAPLRPEACPACGRRVPIKLVRRYVMVREGDV